MSRVGEVYPALHSADVINEEGLSWQIRLLSVDESRLAIGAHPPRGQRRWPHLRSRLAESRVVINENAVAIFSASLRLIAGRRSKEFGSRD